jgi:hypothetical protein
MQLTRRAAADDGAKEGTVINVASVAGRTHRGSTYRRQGMVSRSPAGQRPDGTGVGVRTVRASCTGFTLMR